ncbi:MAG: permease [Planctomycetota bacterium]
MGGAAGTVHQSIALMKTVLLVGLLVFGLGFALRWLVALRSRAAAAVESARPPLTAVLLGFVTDFFDTLGIGSFAPTAAVLRFARMVPDRQIPGTMNVGHTLPVVVMALLFLDLVEVEAATLVTMIACAVVGAWFGAGLVARLPRRPIQIGIGVGLGVAAVLMVMGQLGVMPVGGAALGLSTAPLLLAGVVSVLLGALNTLGIGFYGPCMILVALLGMDPKAAFPIMMGSCAFLMSVGSARFIADGAYSPRIALGITLGGVPAVFLATMLVGSLDLTALRWLVVVVASYTAVMMLWAARRP